MDNDRTNSPNTNRKRATDESSTQPPAKRQCDATTSVRSQTTPAVGTEVARSVSGLDTNQATVQSNPPNHSAESITRRITKYKSVLQALEADHKTLSENRDPEAVSRAGSLFRATTISQNETAIELMRTRRAISVMSTAVNSCRDVVPTQLYQAIEVHETHRDSLVDKLHEYTELEAKQRRQFFDAHLIHRDTDMKLERLSKQISECKINLQSAEQDLNDGLLQQRLDALSRFNVSTLPYD